MQINWASKRIIGLELFLLGVFTLWMEKLGIYFPKMGGVAIADMFIFTGVPMLGVGGIDALRKYYTKTPV